MTWPSTQTQTPPGGDDRHLDADLVEVLALQLVNNTPAGGDRDAAGLDSREAIHVSGCPTCLDLVQQRAAALHACRDEVEGLVDEDLDDDVLKRQREAIQARLAERAESGRVLAFPERETRPVRRDRPALRWLASAAAAGLLVGVAAGQQLNPMLNAHLFGRGHEAASRFSSGLVSWRPESSSRGVQIIPAHGHDELFLSEMETVLNYRGVAELRALDDLTPRAAVATIRGAR